MTGSNIAAAINAAHLSASNARREAVRFAVECGRLLNEAKATVPHGGWDAWLKANCSFSGRSAQLYMKAARYVGDDLAKAQRVADLSLRDLASAIAEDTPKARAARSVAETLAQFIPDNERSSLVDALDASGSQQIGSYLRDMAPE